MTLIFIAFLTASTAVATPTANSTFTLESLPLHPEALILNHAVKKVKQRQLRSALEVLAPLKSPSAALVRGRIFREQARYKDAAEQFVVAAQDSTLAPLLFRERAFLSILEERVEDSENEFLNVMKSGYPKQSDVGREFAKLLQRKSPQEFLSYYETIKNITDDTNHQSLLLGLKAKVLKAQKKYQAADKLIKEQWVSHPLAAATPKKEPTKIRFGNNDRLKRAQVLLDFHQNERALTTLRAIPTKTMTVAQWCQYTFIAGIAHRKLHNYDKAENYLLKAMKKCSNKDLRRRAHFVAAKVISIRDGLRAIKLIEDFAKTFAGHTMVDDVLFWAGDLYQRRDRTSEAIAYYRRAENQSTPGDMCSESRWRRAWMAYRQNKFSHSATVFNEVLSKDGCVKANEDLSRAHYWLGRIAQKRAKPSEAISHFQKAIQLSAMGFYGQMSMSRLEDLDPPLYQRQYAPLTTEVNESAIGICPGAMANDLEFTGALEFFGRGLTEDAIPYILRLKKKALNYSIPNGTCPKIEPGVLVALLLEKAGAKSQAQWFLRSHFKHYLKVTPDQDQLAIIRAAYPLAYRDELKAAEEAHKLPGLFLQALAREESAFNPEVISWAGAYGLTQLLFSVAKSTGRRLSPPVHLRNSRQLLEPRLNAHLGGALMSSLLKRYKGHKGLSLAAYNASVRLGNIWWKRHEKDEFDVFAEELTIRETRHYVKRVLTTYGIYRWLYAQESPKIPISQLLPRVKG